MKETEKEDLVENLVKLALYILIFYFLLKIFKVI